jgi:hypothetical protein
MSAKKLSSAGSFPASVSVTSRDATLDLSTQAVSVHKNGIEFCSPRPFTEWSEMTVALLARDGRRISCHGVIVGCVGSKHTGYHVSMVFTGLNSETEKQLGTMARSELGAG